MKPRKDRGEAETTVFIVVAVIVVAAIVLAVIFGTRSHNRWVSWCQDQGGHVIDDTKMAFTTVVNSNGTVGTGTTTSTTYYCLDSKGTIIDIE